MQCKKFATYMQHSCSLSLSLSTFGFVIGVGAAGEQLCSFEFSAVGLNIPCDQGTSSALLS